MILNNQRFVFSPRLKKAIVASTFSLLLLPTKIFAQQELSEQKATQLKQLATQIDGTYQVQMIDSRDLPVYNLALMEVIEANRSQTDTVYYPINYNMRVMILPRNIIDDPSFQKIPTINR